LIRISFDDSRSLDGLLGCSDCSSGRAGRQYFPAPLRATQPKKLESTSERAWANVALACPCLNRSFVAGDGRPREIEAASSILPMPMRALLF